MTPGQAYEPAYRSSQKAERFLMTGIVLARTATPAGREQPRRGRRRYAAPRTGSKQSGSSERDVETQPGPEDPFVEATCISELIVVRHLSTHGDFIKEVDMEAISGPATNPQALPVQQQNTSLRVSTDRVCFSTLARCDG